MSSPGTNVVWPRLASAIVKLESAVLPQCIRPLIGVVWYSGPSWICARSRSDRRSCLDRQRANRARLRREARLSISTLTLTQTSAGIGSRWHARTPRATEGEAGARSCCQGWPAVLTGRLGLDSIEHDGTLARDIGASLTRSLALRAHQLEVAAAVQHAAGDARELVGERD